MGGTRKFGLGGPDNFLFCFLGNLKPHVIFCALPPSSESAHVTAIFLVTFCDVTGRAALLTNVWQAQDVFKVLFK